MEYGFNFYPIIKVAIICFAIFGFFTLLHILINAIKDLKLGLKHIERENKSKQLDNDVIMELVKKFPDVSEEFMKKSERLQNIENNQEIHEIKKTLRSIGETRKNG